MGHCSWDTYNLKIPGVKHSGDVTSAPYPEGGRETCTINIPDLLRGYPTARYVALAVFSYTRQHWDSLEDASVFVANPHARGTGPGGMAVIGAARLTGAATATIGGYLEIAPRLSAPSPVVTEHTGREHAKSNAGSRARTNDETKTRVYFTFTDQAVDGGMTTASSSQGRLGATLWAMRYSRSQSGEQTLSDAVAFQAALVCDRVLVIPERSSRGVDHDVSDEPGCVGDEREGGISWNRNFSAMELARGDNEERFAFYRRLRAALGRVVPAAPAAGKPGAPSYPTEVFHARGGGDAPKRAVTIFLGGDLDDWLEVARERKEGNEGVPMIMVNVRSAERGVDKEEERVYRVNGATAYSELGEAVSLALGKQGL